jgi:hypothetical protein
MIFRNPKIKKLQIPNLVKKKVKITNTKSQVKKLQKKNSKIKVKEL